MRFFLLPLLAACESTTTVANDTAGGGGDSDTDENIGDTEETGDTGDSADTADTEDTAADEPNLAWDVTGDIEDLSFSLVSLDVTHDFAMADILVEAEASERIEVYAPPPDDQLVQVDGVPGMYYAFFIGGLHEDDGDGRWDPDETWLGAASQMSVYIDGIVPPEVVDLGLHLGWNALILGGESDIVVGDPMAQPLSIAFTDTLTVGGTFDDTVAETDWVTTVSFALFSGIDAPALDDTDLEGGSWTLTLDGEPPASHFVDVDANGSLEAPELFLAYTENGEGWFDPNVDTPLGFACVDGLPLVGWWIAPSTNITDILFMGQSTVSLGWNALAIAGDEPVFLTEEEANSAVLSTGCVID
ncbi:hypothetical protein LBMAG42_23650 [Deltaproteobacteria bacterium]|nr:hypothetical protein LBMAG42_23650 [Deltaproteobacteria bacterium]